MTPRKKNKSEVTEEEAVIENDSIFIDKKNPRNQQLEIIRLETIIEKASESIILTDIEGTIIYVNPHFTKKTGYSPEEAIGNKPSILSSGQLPDSYYQEMWQTLKKGNTWQGEFINKKKDGTIYFEEATIFPIRDDDNNIINYAAVKLDISEQKKTKDEVLKLSQAIHESLNIVMMTKIDGTIDYVNPKFSEVTGYSNEEVLGKNLNFLNYKDDELDKEMWNLLKKNETWQGEFKNQKKDGNSYWEFATITAVKDSKGNTTHYLKDAVDITKRKKSEKDLTDALLKAKLANKTKSDFLANMSHEIRTPMNSILGFISIIKKTKLDKHQDEYIDFIERSSKKLLNIINDILDISKLDTGQFSINCYEFSPIDEFEIELEMFRTMTQNKKIDYITFIDPNLPSIIKSDSIRIRQILNNLISNAYKFTPEYGTIAIDITYEKISETEGIINFSILDTGIGIPEKLQKNIFNAFEQGNASITRDYGGTGLGLSISNSLINHLNGTLKLKSKEMKGSTFYFTIPVIVTDITPKYKKIMASNKSISNSIFYSNKNDTIDAMILVNYLNAIDNFLSVYNSFDEIEIHNESSIIFILFNIEDIDKINKFVLEHPSNKIIFFAPNKSLEIIYKYSYSNMIAQPVTLDKIIKFLSLNHSNNTNNKNDPVIKKTPQNNKSILVAEDNEINQVLIKTMLTNTGYSVTIANNGQEAVDIFKDHFFDMVLMDINMPIVDGIKAMEKIIAHEKKLNLNHTPIIAVTAKAIKGDREQLLLKGFDGYISKPLVIETLQMEISNNLVNIKSEHLSEAYSDANHDNISIADISQVLGIKSDSVIMLLEKFKTLSFEQIKVMESHIIDKNMEDLSRAAHKLKGAATNLRLNKIADLLKKIEINSSQNIEINYNEILKSIYSLTENMKINEVETNE